ncbi:hypothetical protein FRC05_002603 [Tulasnella sp. 425]|nr:hypothetical protein FRC05_002603 [Tulasnella sp. 425]
MSFSSYSARLISRSSRTVLRSSRATPSRIRCLATAVDAASGSTSAAPPLPADPKIQKIVDDISGLTLLQAADLVSLLKTRLNIQEIAMPMASAAVPAAAAPVDDAPAVEEKPKEKTIFTVKLEKIDAANKAKVIKEVKALNPTMSLIDAKKFVESLPKALKENVPKEDAEKLKKALEELGATVVLD